MGFRVFSSHQKDEGESTEVCYLCLLSHGCDGTEFIQTLYDTQPKIMRIIIEKNGASTKYITEWLINWFKM